MGGGRRYMFPRNTPDAEYPDMAKHNGTRKDGRNLVKEWTDRMSNKVHFSSYSLSLQFTSLCSLFILPITFTYLGLQSDCSVTVIHTVLYVRVLYLFIFLTVQKGHYVWNKQQLLSLNPSNVDYLLGKFLVSLKCKFAVDV